MSWTHDYAGVMDSCTIAKNHAGDARGGGVLNEVTGGTIMNSIVYGNTSSGTYPDFRWTASTAGISNNCITKDYTTGGTGNITNNPQFVNSAGGNYRLNKGSPCVDMGTNQVVWMTDAKDLAGHPRVMFGVVDMGAFEYVTVPRGTSIVVQ